MIWGGNFIRFEVFRGTQEEESLADKFKHYAEQEGYVITTTQDYQPNPFEEVTKTALDSGRAILRLLYDLGLYRQFFVTGHAKFIKDPLAETLVTPDKKMVSLLQFISE
jgi:hypothetical protein